MGGAQLFVLRRSLHLVKMGYEVHIIVAEQSDYYPLKDKFNDSPIYVIPETGMRLAQVSKERQNSVTEEFLHIIDGCETCYVESHTLYAIEWGEIFSVKCGAHHLAYPLAEPLISNYKFQPGLKIFKDKLSKGEFYGCTSTSLKVMFGGKKVPDNYINIGYDESELSESSIPSINYSPLEKDYVITTITRFEKKYIEPLADAAAEMAKKYSSQKFVLLIAGGSPDKKRTVYLTENYNNKRYNLSNLDIRYLGYINTLGKDIFNMSDVFVGMGTASINAISQRCITINIDPRNGMTKSSGIFGIDTHNFAYSESGHVYSIFSKLEEVYLSNEERKEEIKSIGRTLFENEFEINACFKKIDDVITRLRPVMYRKSLEISIYYRLVVQALFKLKEIIGRNK